MVIFHSFLNVYQRVNYGCWMYLDISIVSIYYIILYIYIRFTPTYHKVQNAIPNGLVEISGTEMLYGLLGIYSHMLDPMSTIAGHYHIYIYLMFIYLLHPKLEVYCVYWCLLCLLMFIVGSLPHWYWWYFLHSNAKKKPGLNSLLLCQTRRNYWWIHRVFEWSQFTTSKNRIAKYNPYAPWCWNIYQHLP